MLLSWARTLNKVNDIETVLISQSLDTRAWILKSLNDTHYVPLFTSDHVGTNCHELSPFILLIKTLWFIHINAVCALHIYSVRSYSKHLKENKSRVNHVQGLS